MPDEPTTKQAIIDRNQAAAARLNAALDRLSHEQMLAPNATTSQAVSPP